MVHIVGCNPCRRSPKNPSPLSVLHYWEREREGSPLSFFHYWEWEKRRTRNHYSAKVRVSTASELKNKSNNYTPKWSPNCKWFTTQSDLDNDSWVLCVWPLNISITVLSNSTCHKFPHSQKANEIRAFPSSLLYFLLFFFLSVGESDKEPYLRGSIWGHPWGIMTPPVTQNDTDLAHSSHDSRDILSPYGKELVKQGQSRPQFIARLGQESYLFVFPFCLAEIRLRVRSLRYLFWCKVMAVVSNQDM